ncbi:MAG TPA: FtsX-like permease family protein [Solirubrobacteraceae bacterium]|nr:FtsX-like permease family protein [Solirubrobacteraceae bacterium]
MRLSDIFYLYRARLSARAVFVQETLAVLGIAAGVALLFASQVASTSLTRSVQELTRQIVGDTQLQLDARGPQGFSERLLGEVRAVPGVRAALPVLEQPATLASAGRQRSVDLIGADPRFASFSGSLLRHFSARQLAAQRAIALPDPIAEALSVVSLQTIKLQLGTRSVQTLVGATLGSGEIGGLANSPVAVAPIAYAQSVSGLRGRISRAFIRVAPGSQGSVSRRLATLATAANVNLEPANFDSTLFAVAVGPQNKSETLFSGISALVGFMFALNAMLVTVPTRRRLIEDLRPAGATNGMVLQILLFDAAVLGVLACLVGLALGEVLSLAAFHATPGYLTAAFPVGNDRIVTWQSVALAVAAGFAAAFAGVLWPLRDALRDPEARELRATGEVDATRARIALGVACLLATTALLVLRPQSATVGCLTLVAALVCLLPSLFDGLVALYGRSLGLFNSAASVLAITELQAPQTRVRSLAIAATAAVALFGTVAIGGAQTNLERGLDASAREGDASADLWVVPNGGFSSLTTTPFQAVDLQRLKDVAGVQRLTFYRSSFLDWGKRRLGIRAQSNSVGNLIPATQLVSGDLADANAKLRMGGWAVLTTAVAAEQHLRIGARFTLPAPRPLHLRVAALSTNLGWPPGGLILNATDYVRGWGSKPSAYQIQIRHGVSPTVIRRRVESVLGPNANLTVETTDERIQRQDTIAAQGLSRLTEIKLLLLIAAIIAVAGAMTAMIWQRRELIAFVKCQGFQRGVLWRWLLAESAILVSAGCLIGAAFGLYGQLLISHALGSVTGFPIVFDIEGLAAVSSILVISAVALAVIAIPGYLVVRVPARTVGPLY